MEREKMVEETSKGVGESAAEPSKPITATINIRHEKPYASKKLRSKLRFWGIAIFTLAIFFLGIHIGRNIGNKPIFNRTLKFMEQKEELTVESFFKDPINERDWAWNAENVPTFIKSDFNQAILRKYDGVEYNFGENKIRIEEDIFSGNDWEITVNFDLGWSLHDFSIYSSEENIIIYGYWNDEFRRITVGKTEESIVKEILTLAPGVPFSANSKYISDEAKKDYIFVISEDMQTVSAYKDNAIVGNEVVLPEEILGFYDGIMILTKSNEYSNKLYMPYIVNNMGKEELVCLEVANVTAEEVNNVADAEYIDTFQSYITRYSAWIGNVGCYIFENEDGALRMIVPNEIQKYAAYREGTGVLDVEDDLGWHWIIIQE